MNFKQLRNLIYSPLDLIIGDKHLENVEVRDEAFNKYDNYKIIGIRAGINYYFSGDEAAEKLIISLKPDEEE